MVKKQQKRKPQRKNQKNKLFHELEILGGIICLILIITLGILFCMNNSDISFCGDGECSDKELGTCQIDCDWCGDGYCQLDESCESCENDCGSCGSDSFCGDGICNNGECESGCWDDCSYSECENGICEEEKGENCANSNDCKCEDGKCDKESGECIYYSCGNGVCDEDETYLNCLNDCEGFEYVEEDLSYVNYPIVFVHGHSMTDDDSETQINSFQEFQEELDEDNYAIDKGMVLPNGLDLQQGIWSKLDKPISVRTTYYYGVYDEKGDETGNEDNQYISVYSERLGIVVDEVLEATGKNKVIIIAHSMGGLVAREYIKDFGGEDKVDKLVTIGTPNHGTYGYSSFGCESFLGYFGLGRAESSPECEDMQSDSSFILSLNQNEVLVNTLTIRGDITESSIKDDALDCPDSNGGDEVVCLSSVPLDEAKNEIIYSTGLDWDDDRTFHSALIKPSKVKQAYDYVVDFLGF